MPVTHIPRWPAKRVRHRRTQTSESILFNQSMSGASVFNRTGLHIYVYSNYLCSIHTYGSMTAVMVLTISSDGGTVVAGCTAIVQRPSVLGRLAVRRD